MNYYMNIYTDKYGVIGCCLLLILYEFYEDVV